VGISAQKLLKCQTSESKKSSRRSEKQCTGGCGVSIWYTLFASTLKPLMAGLVVVVVVVVENKGDASEGSRNEQRKLES